MESITSLLSIALGAVLVNNFVLSQFLGICPFMGVSKKVETALGMGMAVIFVMGGLRCELAHQRVFEQQGSGLYADRDLYLGHRLSGAVCGNVPAKGNALLV